jgi:integrating conjugative element membrane protein (TIGR03747 family)
MPKEPPPPPPRKPPGLISTVFSNLVQFVVWLILALCLSILIEWGGMVFLWTEEGENHAKHMLNTEEHYLNQQFRTSETSLKRTAINTTQKLNTWLSTHPAWINFIQQNEKNAYIISTDEESTLKFKTWMQYYYQQYQPFIHAAIYVTQLFFIRLTLLFFSLPIFLLAALVGAVDGLVERDLRRWGGGRESSNVYNLARKSVLPAFVSACVIYISLPISIYPAVVILPFAILTGLTVRITCERLKKYF